MEKLYLDIALQNYLNNEIYHDNNRINNMNIIIAMQPNQKV